MPEELLQRMRDIHYPEAPGWFPPAPGWWFLLLLLLLAIGYVLYRWRKRHAQRAPYAEALRLLEEATVQLNNSQLDSREYLDLCNQLLKRLLVHINHNPAAAAASGEGWLTELDRLHGGNQFTKGPGAVLGDSRYAKSPPVSPPDLEGLLRKFIRRLQNNPATGQGAGPL